MMFRLIHAEKDHHEVSLLARVLGVSRQGYYAGRLASCADHRLEPAATPS
ncbi:hypothetical protein [Nonomuraea angiospora]|nr:hypothetical protein [Nonomuraea angiospora]MDX3100348.1 hypothetical protein [Nonomuraea angiospora]